MNVIRHSSAQARRVRATYSTAARPELAWVAGFERYLLKPVAAQDLADLLHMTAPGPG
jgi:hypothetical protein